jgi:CheY-like chemotaxis protein
VKDVTLLLVDDVEEVRRMYEEYFQSVGIRVVTAADGEAALEAVGYESPNIIVLDLSMPKMSGWDVVRHLKQEPWTRRTPIIVLSGLDERESAMAAGAESFMGKPCLPRELLAEVKRLLGQSFPE